MIVTLYMYTTSWKYPYIQDGHMCKKCNKCNRSIEKWSFLCVFQWENYLVLCPLWKCLIAFSSTNMQTPRCYNFLAFWRTLFHKNLTFQTENILRFVRHGDSYKYGVWYIILIHISQNHFWFPHHPLHDFHG